MKKRIVLSLVMMLLGSACTSSLFTSAVTPLPQLPVTNLVVTPDGAVWYSFGNFDFHPRGGGIVREVQGRQTRFMPEASAQVLKVAPDGSLWAGMGCGLMRFAGQTRQTVIENCDTLHGNIIDVAFASDGAAWIATGFKLARYHNGEWTIIDRLISFVEITPDGTVWTSGWEGTQGSQYVARLDGAQWTIVERAAVDRLLAAANSSVWGIKADNSLVRYLGASSQSFADLPFDQIDQLVNAPDDEVWAITDRGVARFDGAQWQLAGNLPDDIAQIAFAPDGSIWVGGVGAISRVERDVIRLTPLPARSAPTPTPFDPAQPTPPSVPTPIAPSELVPDSVSISLSPAQWLGGSTYQLSGPTQASVFAPGAVARVEFFTAPTGTGATPQLEFVDTNGYDGWSWYWQNPRGGSHLWAEAVYANGARASSQVLLILTDAPPPVTWLNYNNQPLQYFLTYPSNWTVDETGLSTPNKEVLFSPPNPEPFLAYFSVSLDGRTLEQIQQSYAQHFPDIPPEWIDFAGQRALRYRFTDQRFELYAPGYYGTFRFASDRATLPEVPQMLSSFRYIVPIGTVPPPTPACDTHTASVHVQPSAQSVPIGQQLVVQVTLLNQGCVALGLPKYTLRVHAPQGQPLFNPPQPESVTHYLSVAPGQSDSAEFVLQAAQVGSGSLQAEVSFEVHIGYPGPAYWGYTTSLPIDIAVTGSLKPPDGDQPAAGICDLASGDVVTANINADVPYPRCLKVLGHQRLQVVNATNGPVQVQLAQFVVQLQPDQAQIFDAAFASYLAPGVHWLRVTGGSGPEIWLISN